MTLPISSPYPPMEAKSAAKLPVGDQWHYEPKWDGFRCLAFRDGAKVELQSKAEKSLTRYFPDLAEELKRLKATRFVLDGEIVVPMGKSFSFNDLLQRIHPAASRVKKLAQEHPARYIVFDLLVDSDGADLSQLPLAQRRPALEKFAKKFLPKTSFVSLSPATTEIEETLRWAKRAKNGLDGIVAKRLDLPYRAGHRDGMVKVKRMRTADCVVGGFRYASKKKTVGSLLLGLYDDEAKLDHVGFIGTAGPLGTAALTRKLEKLIAPPGFTGKAPGGPSRWSTNRSSEWEPLKLKLVVEVQYDHFTGGRFRHGTKLLRWRPDKAPRQCTFEQVDQGRGTPLALVAK